MVFHRVQPPRYKTQTHLLSFPNDASSENPYTQNMLQVGLRITVSMQATKSEYEVFNSGFICRENPTQTKISLFCHHPRCSRYWMEVPLSIDKIKIKKLPPKKEEQIVRLLWELNQV